MPMGKALCLRGGGGAASTQKKKGGAAPTPGDEAAAVRLERALTERPDMEPSLARELDKFPPDKVVANIFEAVDADADGKMTRGELESYLLSRDAWRTKADVAVLFSALDGDGDGGITRDELRAALTEVERLRAGWSEQIDPHNAGKTFYHNAGTGESTRTRPAQGTPPLLWLMALAPPPSGVAIFAGLVREGGPVDIPDAAHRAITLGQLKATLAHAQPRCHAEKWLCKRFSGKAMRVEECSVWKINLYDVATHVILPATHGHRLPDGTTQPSFVELLADGAQRPEYFVSHFWGESHHDFVNCIAQHTRDRAYGGGSFETTMNREIPEQKRGAKGADGDKAKLWVCAYANRQWSLAADVTDDPSQTSFHKAMRLAFGTLAILDDKALYFTRVWCDYEIYVSLTIKEEERDEVARAHGRYTYDVYTAPKPKPLYRDAVGLVDGIAPADSGRSGPHIETTTKYFREKEFPVALIDKGMRARVQEGQASVDADKQHILNAIIGGRELNATVPAEHPRFEEINATLNGRVAADAMTAAIEAGGATLERALEALKAGRATIFCMYLQDCKEATAEVMARVVAALPDSLEHLTIRNCDTLTAAPRLSALTRLRTLKFVRCRQLASLPELSALTQLQTLHLRTCEQLASLPELEALTQLRELNLVYCDKLVTVDKARGKLFVSTPELSARLDAFRVRGVKVVFPWEGEYE